MTYLLTKYKSLSLSILFHTLILIVLAAFTFIPSIRSKWLEFEYLFPEQAIAPIIQQQADTSNPRQTAEKKTPAVTPSLDGKQAPNNDQTIPHAQTNPNTSGTEPIEMPQLASTVKKPQDIDLPVNPGLKGILRNLTNDSGSIGNAMNVSFEGGGIIPTVPRGLKHSLGEPGWVVLTFKLDNSARVIQNSVIPLQQSSNRFVDEAKSILAKCSFQYKGEYESGKEYRIRINFQ